MKLGRVNTTWPVIYTEVQLQANTKQGVSAIFPVAYLHKGLLPPPYYVKCLPLHSLSCREYQRKCLYGVSPCVSPKESHLYSKAGVYTLHALRYFSSQQGKVVTLLCKWYAVIEGTLWNSAVNWIKVKLSKNKKWSFVNGDEVSANHILSKISRRKIWAAIIIVKAENLQGSDLEKVSRSNRFL